MHNVWMIRNDGKVFPCAQHIYANPKNLEETLFASQWLYVHTRHNESRQLALETIAAWLASVSVDGSITSNVLNTISQESYRFLLQDFVKEYATEIKSIPTGKLNLTSLCYEVTAELNQEFLRVCYGEMSQTEISSKELSFFISSIGFDWYKIIRYFVSSANFQVEHIAIVRDDIDTDAKNKFYLRLPTEKFLSEKPIKLTPQNKIKGGVMAREIFAHLSCSNALRHILGDLSVSDKELKKILEVFSSLEKRRIMTFTEDSISDGIFLWDRVDDFHKGFARVHSGNYWGYIDKNGMLVTSAIYDDARIPYWNDKQECYEAEVNLNGKWLTISFK